MANTFNDYTATSAQLDSSNAAYGFVFNFPFLDASHIVVEVDGSVLASSNYSIQTSPDKRVLVASGITAGQVVRVKRDSNADSDAPLVDFVNGSVLNETELDKSYLHNLYLNEEIAAMNDLSLQKKVGDTTKWDAKSQELVNVTDPTLVQSASTKNYVDTQISNTITGSSTVSSKYTFTGDNTTTAFTFSPAINLDGDTMYEVAIDGVLQAPTTAYTIDANANTITFTSAPPTSAAIVVVQRGYAVPVTINSQGLRVVDSSGISGTASFVQDGDSTNSALAISTTKVGIGTASPSEKLEVDGDVLISTGGDATLYLGKGAEGVDGVTKIKAVQTGTDTDNLGLAFFVHPSSSGSFPASEAMRIDSDGKVGIGTASPSAVLHLDGDSSNLGGLMLGHAGGVGIDSLRLYIDANNKAHITRGASDKLTIDSAGKVGIGTDSPDEMLELEDGNIRLKRTDDLNSQIHFANNTANMWSLTGDADNDFVIERRVKSTGAFINKVLTIEPASTEAMRIASDGNVGIGGIPVQLATNASPGLTITSNGPYILLQDANNANKTRYIANNTGDFQFGIIDDNGASGKTENMRIKSDGTINFSNVSTYADDTAAGTGGLVAGDVYKTSTGELRIKL